MQAWPRGRPGLWGGMGGITFRISQHPIVNVSQQMNPGAVTPQVSLLLLCHLQSRFVDRRSNHI